MRTLVVSLAFFSFVVGQAGRVGFAADPPAVEITAEDAFARLQDGNRRFIADKAADREAYSTQRKKTAQGQHPCAIVLTCSDSRVVPELIFNQQLGDVFVVRVAGNVTDPIVLGSMEYAVVHLHAPLVIVLGHTKCGAVKAAEEGGQLEGNLGELIKQVHVGDNLPADKDQAVEAGIRNNVAYQTKTLTTASKVLAEYAKDGRIRLMGGVYSLESGKVEWLKSELPQ